MFLFDFPILIAQVTPFRAENSIGIPINKLDSKPKAQATTETTKIKTQNPPPGPQISSIPPVELAQPPSHSLTDNFLRTIKRETHANLNELSKKIEPYIKSANNNDGHLNLNNNNSYTYQFSNGSTIPGEFYWLPGDLIFYSGNNLKITTENGVTTLDKPSILTITDSGISHDPASLSSLPVQLGVKLANLDVLPGSHGANFWKGPYSVFIQPDGSLFATLDTESDNPTGWTNSTGRFADWRNDGRNNSPRPGTLALNKLSAIPQLDSTWKYGGGKNADFLLPGDTLVPLENGEVLALNSDPQDMGAWTFNGSKWRKIGDLDSAKYGNIGKEIANGTNQILAIRKNNTIARLNLTEKDSFTFPYFSKFLNANCTLLKDNQSVVHVTTEQRDGKVRITEIKVATVGGKNITWTNYSSCIPILNAMGDLPPVPRKDGSWAFDFLSTPFDTKRELFYLDTNGIVRAKVLDENGNQLTDLAGNYTLENGKLKFN